jgi:hypothetical protein
MSKKEKIFTKRKAILQFDLGYDKVNDRHSMIGFRPNPQKGDEKRSSLVILPRIESELYPQMEPREFWEVEYYETDDAKIARATPLRRAPLDYKIEVSYKVNKRGVSRRMVGVVIFVPGTPLGVNNVIFKKVFPESRKYTEDIEGRLIEKIVDDLNYGCYQKDILAIYRRALDEVALIEAGVKDIVEDATSYVQDIDNAGDQETKGIHVNTVIREIKNSFDPYKGEAPDPAAIAQEVANKLKIVSFNQELGEFNILA